VAFGSRRSGEPVSHNQVASLRRRRDLLELLDRLNPTIAELSQPASELGYKLGP